MKKILAAATVAALAGLSGVANAADVYSGGGMKDVPLAPPPPLWTGFYLGGHLGADWADINVDRSYLYGYNTYPQYGWGGDGVSAPGAFGGAQLGYNWQTTNFLLGVEIDLGGASLGLDHSWYAPAGVGASIKSDGGFYGDVTGRIGYTWGPALLYAKGGFAWLESDLKANIDYGSTTYSHDFNNTLTGWTVGGGLEYLVNPHWTFKIEYLFFDFQNCDHNWNYYSTYNWNLMNKDLEVNTVKLGFNYLWNSSAPVPLK